MRQQDETTETPVSFADFYAEEFAPTPYLVHDLLVKQGINMLSGGSTVGKTWVTLEFALQVASGGKVFGYFPVVEQVNVLLINEEDTKRSLQSRLHLMTKESDIPLFIYTHAGIRLDDEKIVDQVIQQVVLNDIGLVILDNLTQLHGLDENVTKDIQKVIHQMKRITQAGAAVLVVHHHRKDTANTAKGASLRGSSSLFNSLDIHIVLEKIPDASDFVIGMTVEKNKDDKELQGVSKLILRQEAERFFFEYGGASAREVSSAMKLEDMIYDLLASQSYGRKLDCKEIIAASGKDRRQVKEALANLGKHYRIQSASKASLGIGDGRGATALVYWAVSREEQEGNLFSPVFDTAV